MTALAMRPLDALSVTALALSLTGCVLGGKQQAAKNVPPAPAPTVAPAPPPPPPAPLSIPQTHAELPTPQPVNPDALATQAVEAPATVAPSKPRGRPSPSAAKPVEAAAPAAAPTAPPPEPERGPIQEIVQPSDQAKLQNDAESRKREVRQRLEQNPKTKLTRQQRNLVDRIEGFLKVSEEAEKRGDMRKAYELAERAAVLARELPGGK